MSSYCSSFVFVTDVLNESEGKKNPKVLDSVLVFPYGQLASIYSSIITAWRQRMDE